MKPLTTLEKLLSIRTRTGDMMTYGLTDEQIEQFLQISPDLKKAIEFGALKFEEIITERPDIATTNEQELAKDLANGFMNFYPDIEASQFVPLAAKGPWIITLYGAVLYDTGGYGMIGHGHNPESILMAMSEPRVMANIRTPSFSQERFMKAMRSNIGHLRSEKKCPYDRFICMNSGSEAMAVATRITDAHAKVMTDPDGKYAGRTPTIITLTKSFHGRTTRPARISHSSRKKYQALASYRNLPEHGIVDPNNTKQLLEVWDQLLDDGHYIEAIVLEPVMGEGNPGQAISREFYDLARKLTKEHGSFLLIDSIQAGLRAQGVLSIVDYPDFLDCDPPDMESYSKALNGGQFPLSVLAMNQRSADAYAIGTYGNTMTGNPRGLEVGVAVLDMLNSSLTENVRKKGVEFVEKMKKVAAELPGLITKVQGTGLLISAELHEKIPVVAFDGAEQRMCKKGVNVIHGGTNSLRYTPWFHITSEEIDLICEITKETLLELNEEAS